MREHPARSAFVMQFHEICSVSKDRLDGPCLGLCASTYMKDRNLKLLDALSQAVLHTKNITLPLLSARSVY